MTNFSMCSPQNYGAHEQKDNTGMCSDTGKSTEHFKLFQNHTNTKHFSKQMNTFTCLKQVTYLQLCQFCRVFILYLLCGLIAMPVKNK